MITRTAFAVGSLLLASAASAHQVWLERGEGQTAKVYYGEPAAGELEKAGGGLDQIDPVVFHSDAAKPLGESRQSDHVKIDGVGNADLRLLVDRFPVWKEADGTHQRAVYYAREGRTETRHALDLELVPEAAGSDTFVLMLRGKPAAEREIALLAPGRWSKTLKTDANGRVVLPTPWPGRYIAEAVVEEDVPSQAEGKAISKTYHVSTVSFTDAS